MIKIAQNWPKYCYVRLWTRTRDLTQYILYTVNCPVGALTPLSSQKNTYSSSSSHKNPLKPLYLEFFNELEGPTIVKKRVLIRRMQ